MDPVEAIRRKLRGLVAVIADPATTEHERANATDLAVRLKAKLKQEGAPEGDWTDKIFRAGQRVRHLQQATSPMTSAPRSSRVAFRLGKALRLGLKKWDRS